MQTSTKLPTAIDPKAVTEDTLTHDTIIILITQQIKKQITRPLSSINHPLLHIAIRFFLKSFLEDPKYEQKYPD
jgi:hypothetical protein